MAIEKSFAEETGMSYEDRCKEALLSLRGVWTMFQTLSTEDLQFRQEMGKMRQRNLANLSEPIREEMKAYLEKLPGVDPGVGEKFYQGMWEETLKITREVYGSDATDFALKIIGADKARN